MYCLYGNSGGYIHGDSLFGGCPLLGGSVIGGSTVLLYCYIIIIFKQGVLCIRSALYILAIYRM